MIRAAVLEDVEAIVGLGLCFMRETVYGQVFPENVQTMTAFVRGLIETPEQGAIFVAERDGSLVGMLGLCAYTHPMFGVPCVIETFWYVDPAVRGGSTAIRLMSEAERWARERGAQVLQMVAPFGAAAVCGIYRKLGYVPVESSWQKRLVEA